MKRKANTSEGSSKNWYAEAFKHDSSGRDPPTKKRKAQEEGQPKTDEPPSLQHGRYFPLEDDYIRVLYLEPGEFDADLRGSLVHIGLQDVKDDHYAYEAISYAWGEPVFSGNLYVEDCGILPLTSSLATALRYFRRKDMERALWADAVCINQSDVAEKSSQVSTMHTVFELAENVLVWLGPSDGSDPLVFCTMQAAARIFEPKHSYRGEVLRRALDRVSAVISSSPKCPCCGDPFPLPEFPAFEGLVALRSVYDRAWFSRLWVVQEVMAAEDRFQVIVCSGWHTAPWSNYFDAFTLLNGLASTTHGPLSLRDAGHSLEEMDIIEEEYFQQTETFESGFDSFRPGLALAKLCRFRSRYCSEPLDRLYAVNQILGLRDRDELCPNYSLSPAEAYSRLAIACLSGPWSVYTFNSSPEYWFAVVGTESETGATLVLPSWVPNLNRLTERSESKARLYCNFGSDAQFYPFPKLFKLLQSSSDPRKLWVRGRVYARIEEVLTGSQWPNLSVQHAEISAQEYITKALQWIGDCMTFANYLYNLHGKEPTVVGFVDLILCGMRKGVAPTRAIYHDVANIFNDRCRTLLNPTDFWLNEGSYVLQEFLNHSYWWDIVDQERQLCYITGDGGDDIGWIPREARVGDAICLIAGAQYPFVVREYEDGCYQMLGDAYTSWVKLKEALGGDVVQRNENEVNRDRTDMDWREDSRGMRRLLRGLDWIALR